MRIYSVAIVLGALGAVLTQTTTKSAPQEMGFPQECQNILNNAVGGVTYPPTSTANSINTFCPVITEFTDCLERNLPTLRNSQNPVNRILGENFDKEDIRSKMTSICNSIPAIANQLECLRNDTNVKTCSDQHNGLVQQSNLTLQSLCGIITNTESCLRNSQGIVCPDNVVEFYIQFQRVFIPPCVENSHTATGTDTVNIDSVFFNCIAGSFPTLIAKLGQGKIDHPADIVRIVYESFENVCRNRTVFAECVKQRFVPPLSAIDSLVDKFLNQNAVGTVLNQLCEVALSPTEQTCLQDSFVGMVLCGNSLTKLFPSTSINTGGPPDYISLFCPALHAVNTCVRIQLQRCSPQLGKTFMTVEKELLTPECISAVSPQIENSPLTSVFVYCGLPFWRRNIEVGFFNKQQRGQDTTEMVKGLIPDACKFAPSYTTCLAREIVNSDNIFDNIAQKFLDLTDGNRLQKIVTEICDQTIEIQDKIECLRDTFETTGSKCVADPKYMRQFEPYAAAMRNGNFSALNVDGIRELCGPMKEIGVCAAQSMSNCSQELAKTGETVINELLRTDCGGSRLLTGTTGNTGPKNVPLISMIVFILSFFAVFNSM